MSAEPAAAAGAESEAQPQRISPLADGLIGVLLVALFTAVGTTIGLNQTVAGLGRGTDAFVGALVGATIGVSLLLGVRWARQARPLSLVGGIVSFFLAAWLAGQFLGFLDVESPV
ncbi:MAG: hypothetical protein ACRD1Z_00065, partial [Vicinamibacteria bacterium]